MGLRIVKKVQDKEYIQRDKDKYSNNAAYAWNVQWQQDALARKVPEDA